MHLISFETKFKMAVFNMKFVNVVELFINYSKMNNLGVPINACKPLL